MEIEGLIKVIVDERLKSLIRHRLYTFGSIDDGNLGVVFSISEKDLNDIKDTIMMNIDEYIDVKVMMGRKKS